MSTPTLPHPTASLSGKSALVTGGGRGIGKAISLQLASKSITNLAITYVSNKSSADDVASQCLALGAKKVVTIHADLLSPSVGPDLIKAVREGLKVEVLDIVINNAALVDITLSQPFQETTLEGFSKMMQGNTFAAMSIIAAAMPYFPTRNGRVINISSVASKEGMPDPFMGYSASKAALESYTRSLAMTFASQKLCTFNSVSVGGTRTETVDHMMSSGLMPKGFIEKQTERPSAEKRFGEPEDIGLIVGWLASEESRWINGASMPANGGDRYVLCAQG